MNNREIGVQLRKFNLLLQKVGHSKEEAREISQKAKLNVLTENHDIKNGFKFIAHGRVDHAFIWSQTPEGFIYWSKINSSLWAIVR